MLKCDLSRLKPAAKLKSRLLMGSRWLTELNPKKVAAFKVSLRLAELRQHYVEWMLYVVPSGPVLRTGKRPELDRTMTDGNRTIGPGLT